MAARLLYQIMAERLVGGRHQNLRARIRSATLLALALRRSSKLYNIEGRAEGIIVISSGALIAINGGGMASTRENIRNSCSCRRAMLYVEDGSSSGICRTAWGVFLTTTL